MPFVILLAAIAVSAQVTFPARPGEREFIADTAGVIKHEDAAEIRRLCDRALSEKQVPIIICTIPSLAAHGASGWTADRYARELFDEWRVGFPNWNHGMLLLVSVGDRRYKVAMGNDCPLAWDQVAQRVMDGTAVPRFKSGDYGRGILEGTRGLQAVALGLSSPGHRAPPPTGDPSVGTRPGCGGGIGMIVVIVVVIMLLSAFRRGTSGWGPGSGYGSGSGCNPFMMGCLGSMAGNMLFSGRSHRSSWGGFSGGGSRSWGGGSFGGGFSRRGGASGSW
jgi:uncharacterized protein